MKTFISVLIVLGVVFFIVCLNVTELKDWCIALTFNSICFIDNSLEISRIISPLILWPFIFALFGACYGLVRAVKRFNLNRVIKIAGIVGSFLLLLITVSISKPTDNGNSREVGEKILWDKINARNSYNLSTLYLERFPDGKYTSQVRTKQEQALWDSAIVFKSLSTWSLFLKKFPNSGRYFEARKYHEDLLWSETKNLNNTSGYNNYINQYPNGRFSRKAYLALKKLNVQPEQVAEIPAENVADTIPIIEEQVKEIYGKIDLPGGRRYEGTLVNGEPGGKGREIFPDNTYLEGTWVNGKREGVFTFHKTNGTTESQEFFNGDRVK